MDLELIALATLAFLICWWFTVPLVIAAARALHNRQPLRIQSWRAGSVSTDTEHGPLGTLIIGGIALFLALGPVIWIFKRLVALISP